MRVNGVLTLTQNLQRQNPRRRSAVQKGCGWEAHWSNSLFEETAALPVESWDTTSGRAPKNDVSFLGFWFLFLSKSKPSLKAGVCEFRKKRREKEKGGLWVNLELISKSGFFGIIPFCFDCGCDKKQLNFKLLVWEFPLILRQGSFLFETLPLIMRHKRVSKGNSPDYETGFLNYETSSQRFETDCTYNYPKMPTKFVEYPKVPTPVWQEKVRRSF